MSNLEIGYSRFKKQIVSDAAIMGTQRQDPFGQGVNSRSLTPVRKRRDRVRDDTNDGATRAYGEDLAMFGGISNLCMCSSDIRRCYWGGLAVPALGLGVAGFFTAGLAAAGAGTGEVMVAVLM